MSRLSLLFAVAAALAALPAAAQQAAPMTYADFEVSVPHLDLETCPAALAEPGVFCRAALANDAIHVYAFAEDGAQPFRGMRTYYAGDFRLSFD